MEFHRLCIGLIFLSTMPSCLYFRSDFGITAKTYDNFTKNDAEKYNYAFDFDNITYKDRNGKEVILTDEEQDLIVDKVNQCLVDAGYGYSSSKTKTMLLKLDFTEEETKDADIYYDEEMIKRYQGKYNFNFEPYVGPQNKTFIILHQGSNELFINYSGNDKIYFLGVPNYSKFGGITFRESFPLDVSCKQRSGLFCKWGKTDLSNFYAKLSGSDGNMTKFDINLHYKQNLLTSKNDIKKTRKYIIDNLAQYICLFIGDKIEDQQVVPWHHENGLHFKAILSHETYGEYQEMKNKINNSKGNYYVITEKSTGSIFNNVSTYFECTNCGLRWRGSRYYNHENQSVNYDLYDNKIDKILFYSNMGGRTSHSYYLQFYNLKYPISQLEIKNKYSN